MFKNLTLYRKTWLNIACVIDTFCYHEVSLLESAYNQSIVHNLFAWHPMNFWSKSNDLVKHLRGDAIADNQFLSINTTSGISKLMTAGRHSFASHGRVARALFIIIIYVVPSRRRGPSSTSSRSETNMRLIIIVNKFFLSYLKKMKK